MSFLSTLLGANNQYNAPLYTPTNTFQSTDPASAAALGQANSQAAGGAGPASGTIAGQNALNAQLQAAANGQGPNPALAQLQQTTQQNVANAAGTVASQRGINPALAARMAVDQGAGLNQQAAGQAAVMDANQQIAARQQLGQNLSATAQTQLGQQAGGVSALGTAGGLNLQSQGINAGVAQQNTANQQQSNAIMAGQSAQNAGINAGLIGGVINAAGVAAGMATGGEVPDTSGIPSGVLHSYLDSLYGGMFDTGGAVPNSPGTSGDSVLNGGAPPAKSGKPAPLMAPSDPTGLGAYKSAIATPMGMYATGGSIHHRPVWDKKVPVQVSPQETIVPPGTTPIKAAQAVAAGAGKVPGKAKVAGDSKENDTVHVRVRPGSIVIPRSQQTPKKAAAFLASVVKRGAAGPMPKKMAEGGAIPRAHSEQAEGNAPFEIAYDNRDESMSADEELRREKAQDLSNGGLVDGPPKPIHTAQGRGRGELARRMKPVAAKGG
jgi:hypothetical protein